LINYFGILKYSLKDRRASLQKKIKFRKNPEIKKSGKNMQDILSFYYHRTSKKAFNCYCMTEVRKNANCTIGKLLNLLPLHDNQMSAIIQEGSNYE